MKRFQAFVLVAASAALIPAVCSAQSPPPGVRYLVQEPTLLNPKPGRFIVTRNITLGDPLYPGVYTFVGGLCTNFSEKMDSDDTDLTKTEDALKEKLVKDVHECIELMSKISQELK